MTTDKYLGIGRVGLSDDILLVESIGISSGTLWEMVSMSETAFALRNVKTGAYLAYNEDESVALSETVDANDQWSFVPVGDVALIQNLQSGNNLEGAVTGVAISTDNTARQHWVSIEADSSNNGLGELFDSLYSKILEREAFSPPKDLAWGSAFESRVEDGEIRERFVQANSAPKLFGAFNALNNTRRDNHLRLESFFPFNFAVAPISFLPDFSDSDMHDISKVRLFVSRVGSGESMEDVMEGDELISVNGMPLADYLEIMIPEYRMSTLAHGLVRKIGPGLAEYHEYLSAELYREDGNALYRLAKEDGTEYEALIGYDFDSFNSVDWRNPDPLVQRDYEGYTRVLDNIDLQFWIPDPGNNSNTVIIRWMDLDDVDNSLGELIEYADVNGYLGYNVIFDATICGGGLGSPLVIQRLASSPFKTTFGNVRCSELSLEYTRRRLGEEITAWVEESCEAGDTYTTNEPFKLRYFERGDAGIMDPEQKRFRGDVIALFFP